MNGKPYSPTLEQIQVILHAGSAFVSACPGAGKTRVMVERARQILRSSFDGRGIAFLSFTRSAISELESRLTREVLLGSVLFPNYVGTFDSFIWQFIIAPFGIPEVEAAPRLVPDKRDRIVQPFERAQSLPLSYFDRVTGQIDGTKARRSGFDVTGKSPAQIKAFETAARTMLTRFRQRGELDFDDAREIALARLGNKDFSSHFAVALAARFGEIIIDEAQDCNPVDLNIIKWFRDAGIRTKIVCDPHQSIYGFRGGLTNELFAFENTFAVTDRLRMSGNFRSSPNICRAIVMLRAKESRNAVDEPLGEFKHEKTPVYILSYNGQSVPSAVGQRFAELVYGMKICLTDAPVLAATRHSGSNAIGESVRNATHDLTFRLAEAVSNFFLAFDTSNQRSALEEMHKVVLELQGHLVERSYHQHLLENGLRVDQWRPQMLSILRTLKYDSTVYTDPDAWHNRAKQILAPFLPEGGPSIAQKLRKNKDIVHVLRDAPTQGTPAKTIHSVKGMEFPAVCVVTVPKTLRSILDYLQTGAPAAEAESARELYVAASRAQRLLAIAVPSSQSARFADHLRAEGAVVTVVGI